MTEKKLIWKKNDSKHSKYDKSYVCYNKNNELLGLLCYENVGAHMHWCWRQLDIDIRMSPGCLQEVRDKQKELYHGVRK